MRKQALFAAALTLSAVAEAALPARYQASVPGRPVESAAPAPLSAARRAELEDSLGRWRQVKRRARAMVDELNEAYRGDPQETRVKAWTEKFWGLVETAADNVYKTSDKAKTMIPDSDKARREALEKLTLARIVRLYGNIAPRTIEELVKDPSGRRFAREFVSSWALELTEAEADALEAELKAATGLPADALGKFPRKD